MVLGGYSNDALLRHLAARQGDWADAGLRTVTTIGDAHAPSTIARPSAPATSSAANSI
jgi:dimethylamine/trimethylamine dehydrogenase